MGRNKELRRLQEEIISCKKCERLATYLQHLATHRPKRFRDWTYWAKPLPSFGDPEARLLIVGLAPAAHGGNRTGRMFTGDRSGEWLFQTLYQFGFANQPVSSRREDGLRLKDCYITATIHCAPPKNKPLPQEIENCRDYFLRELDLLKKVQIIVPLGQIAFIQTIKSLRRRGYNIPSLSFGHGRRYPLSKDSSPSLTLVTSYHPSQQNTQTGRLTREMFQSVFNEVLNILKKKIKGQRFRPSLIELKSHHRSDPS